MRNIYRLYGSILLLLGSIPLANAQQVFDDAVSMQDSLCVGFDCAAASDTSFGSEIVLRENNTRLRLLDSNVAVGPAQGWNLEANASSSGGINYFRFETKGSGSPMPVLTFGTAPSGSITFGLDSVVADGQVSVGSEALLRTVTHIALAESATDALTFGVFTAEASADVIQDKQQRITQLQDEIAELELLVGALEQGDFDGDGIPNIDDLFPLAVTAITVGGISLETSLDESNSSCSINSASSIPVINLPPAPSGVQSFDHALSFVLHGCPPGASIELTVDFGQPIPANYVALKVGNPWRVIANAQVEGNVLRYTLTDGGPYDADGTVNGTIIDPVTMGTPPAKAIPVNGLWGLLLLCLMLAMLGAVLLPRRQSV